MGIKIEALYRGLCGWFCKVGVALLDVFMIRTLLFAVCISGPQFVETSIQGFKVGFGLV